MSNDLSTLNKQIQQEKASKKQFEEKSGRAKAEEELQAANDSFDQATANADAQQQQQKLKRNQ